MLIASRNGTISAATLIKQTRYAWTLLDEQREVRISKSDTQTRVFSHMADALKWVGAGPELIAQFSDIQGGRSDGQASSL